MARPAPEHHPARQVFPTCKLGRPGSRSGHYHRQSLAYWTALVTSPNQCSKGLVDQSVYSYAGAGARLKIHLRPGVMIDQLGRY